MLKPPLSNVNISDVQGADQHEFTEYYRSTALRPVASYVPRLALHTQMKERLHDTLEKRGRSCKILVVCGLGGAGKSQLVLNYVEDFKDDYTASFWIDASSKERLESDYRQIHNLLLHPKRDDAAIDVCISEVKQWCHRRKGGRHLFVLDSADDIEDEESGEYIDLQRYIVDVASADVVITTRIQSAKDMADLEAVQVAELTPEESRLIFSKRLRLSNPDLEMQKEIDAVTEELGHFALAVSLAAAHVGSTRRLKAHPSAYLVEYAERKKTLLARKPKQYIDQYGESVLTTWEISYAAISNQCPEACNLLTFLAFLDSSIIFPELLQSNLGTASRILASMIWVQASTKSVQDTLDRGFETLELYSFLQWSDQHESYSMHKLVYTWAFERLESTKQAVFCFAVWNYLHSLSRHAWTIPAMSGRLVTHIMACFVKVRTLCHVKGLAFKSVVELVSDLINFLASVGQYDLAHELQLFAHEYHEHRRSTDRMAYIKSLYDLSKILRLQSKYDAMEAPLRQALDEIKEPASWEGVRIKELCQRSLAKVLSKRYGKHSEAEQMLRTLLRQQSQRNEDKKARLLVEWRLGDVIFLQGRYGEAEKLYKRLLDTPDIKSDWNRTVLTSNLSRALVRQNKLAEAENLARRENEIVQVHGPGDLRSQCALLDLGQVKLAQKAYGEAATVFGLACDATANTKHVFHLRCQRGLAFASRKLHLYQKALKSYTSAVNGFNQVFGAEHPLTQDYTAELVEFRAFLTKRDAEKAEYASSSDRITKALEAGHALATRDPRLRTIRHRSASSCFPSRSEVKSDVRWTDSWAADTLSHSGMRSSWL